MEMATSLQTTIDLVVFAPLMLVMSLTFSMMLVAMADLLRSATYFSHDRLARMKAELAAAPWNQGDLVPVPARVMPSSLSTSWAA